MIYEALVIDNSDFYKKGTIRVRIKDYSLSPSLTEDISKNPTKSINVFGKQEYKNTDGERTFTYRDTDVRVSSPIGGGYDYGIFYLPQPNSWGLVAQLGNTWENRNKDNFVWMGALYQRDIITQTINIPSDQIENKYSGVEGDARTPKKHIENFESAFVMKTKTTKISGGAENINQQESIKSLDWKKQPAENLTIMDRDKFQVSHNILNKKNESIAIETIQFNKDGILINYYDKENGKVHKFSLSNNGDFEIKKDAKDGIIEVVGNNKEFSANYDDSKGNSSSLKIGKKEEASLGGNYNTIATLSASQGNKGCAINVKDTGIDIEANGNINLSCTNGNVSIGKTGRKLLCSPTDKDIMIGNITLPVSDAIG